MSDKRQKRRAGIYFINDKAYISVTKILSVIDKSQPLMYWFGRHIWEGMVADPSLSWEEARSLPYKENKKAKQRGSDVHNIIETYKITGKLPNEDGDYTGYIQAFNSWVRDFNVEIVEQERTIFSDKYGYAGTVDMLANVNGEKRIVDVKTGKDLYEEVHLQTSAYKQALLEEGVIAHNTSALLLMEDGTYKYQLNRDELPAFLSAKKLFEGLNRDLLKKIDYEF